MGRIGQKIAKVAKSLGMIIHYHNRSKLGADKEDGAIYHDNLKDLLSVSDVLSVCCPASKETIDIINKDTIEYLPKGAVVTNVARGDIIEDEALIDALNRRKVYAVGLDVYKNEPNLNPGYLKHKSAFILPHLGSATKETRTAMANLAIDIGCTAIMISNHGGRQLDGSRSPFDQVKAISDAVGDKLEIILDGGVRRGTHVLKALAAGATACSFGKMFLFSLAAGGQEGVERLLQNMHDEINRNMVLMGCKNLKELNSSRLIYRK